MHPDLSLFGPELDAESKAAMAGFGKDADKAGKDAGEDLRGGVKDGTEGIEGDLGAVGANSGMAFRDGARDGAKDLEKDLGTIGSAGGVAARDGVKDGTRGIGKDLAEVGANAGGNLRKGVEGETGKLADDAEKDGERTGDSLSKGMGKGFSKLANLVSNTGLPLGGLSSKLDETGKSLQGADSKASGLGGTLSHVGGYALLGVAAGFGVAAVAGIKMAEGMQTADASIKSATGSSMRSAEAIGNAFLGTAFKSVYGGKELTTAYAGVAGQLKETVGHVLSTGEAFHVMTAAQNLAEGAGITLAGATETVSKTMQTFQLKTGEASHAADVLFEGAKATGTSVEAFGQQLAKIHAKLGETGGSVSDLTTTMVALANAGVTGRAQMTAMNSGMQTLLTSSDAVAGAVKKQKTAYDAMSPSSQALAKGYESGKLTSEQFTAATKGLSGPQAALATAFTSASTAVQTAQLKYKEMGVTVYDSSGKFVGMGSVIDQLYPKFSRMDNEQKHLAATTLFGKGSAEAMTKVIDEGPAAYEKAAKAVNTQNAAQQAAAAQSKTLHRELEALGKGVGDVVTVFGEKLIPIVTAVVGTLAKGTLFVMQHKAAMIALAVVIGGPVVVAISAYVATMVSAAASSVLAFASVAAGAQSAEAAGLGATASMAAGWISSAAEAITSAGVTVASWIGIGTAAETGGAATAAGIAVGTAGISLLLVGIVELALHWKAVWDTIKMAVSDAVSFIEAHWKLIAGILIAPIALPLAAFMAFHKQIEAGFTKTVGFITTAWSRVKAVTLELVNGIVGFFTALPGRVASFFTNIANWVVTQWNRLKTETLNLVNSVVSFFSALPGRIVGFFTNIVQNVRHAWDTVTGETSKLINGVVKFFEGLPGKILGAISSVVGDIVKVWQKIEGGVSSLIGSIVKFFSGLPGKVVGAVKALPGDMLKLGEEMGSAILHGVEGLAKGFLGMLEKEFLGPVKELVSEVENLFSSGGGSSKGASGGGSGEAGGASTGATGSIVEKYGPMLEKSSKKYGIPESVLAGDIEQESGGIPVNPSSAGAEGLTQFIPSTAAQYGVKYGSSKADEESQIEGQAHYLHNLGGTKDIKSALEGYLGEHGPQGEAYANSVLSKAKADEGAAKSAPGHTKATTDHEKAVTKDKTATEQHTKALGGGATTGTGSGTSSTSAAEKAASKGEAEKAKALKAEEAALKAKLAKEETAQKTALTSYESKMEAEAVKAGAQRKGAIAQELAEHKTEEAARVAGLKSGEKIGEATQKAAEAQRTADNKKGLAEISAITHGSLSKMSEGVVKEHGGALKVLEAKLDTSHKQALKDLAGKLESTWAAGVKKFDEAAAAVKAKKKEEEEALTPAGKAKAQEKGNIEGREVEAAFAATPEGKADAAAKAQEVKEANEKTAGEESLKAQENAETEKIALIDKQSKIETDIAESKAQEMGDATKVALDKQAEVGLSGTAEIAAHLQTVFDELTGNMDRSIDAAKQAQDETVGKGAVAEAEAAARTSRVEAEAKVKEAEASRQLELAKATVSTAGAGAGLNIESLVINGAGMSSAEITAQIGWSLRTGELPVAQAAVPA